MSRLRRVARSPRERRTSPIQNRSTRRRARASSSAASHSRVPPRQRESCRRGTTRPGTRSPEWYDRTRTRLIEIQHLSPRDRPAYRLAQPRQRRRRPVSMEPIGPTPKNHRNPNRSGLSPSANLHPDQPRSCFPSGSRDEPPQLGDKHSPPHPPMRIATHDYLRKHGAGVSS